MYIFIYDVKKHKIAMSANSCGGVGVKASAKNVFFFSCSLTPASSSFQCVSTFFLFKLFVFVPLSLV